MDTLIESIERSIAFVLSFSYSSYGMDYHVNVKIAEKAFEIMEKNTEAAYISKFVCGEMHTKNYPKFSKLKNLYVYEEDCRHVSIPKAVGGFKKWKDENYPKINRIELVVAPPIREECEEELEKVFSDSNIQIYSAEFLGIKKGFWFSNRSALWCAKSEGRWEIREWWRKFLKPRLSERVYEKAFS